MSIFLFFLPGLLLIFSRSFSKKGLVEFLTYSVGSSLAFFLIVAPLLGALHISLLGSAYLVFIISLMLLLINRKRFISDLPLIDKNELLVLAIFVLVVTMRIVPLALQAAPSGYPQSIIASSARFIVDEDRSTSVLASGLPSLSALIAMLSDIAEHRSVFFMSCASYAFIAFGLYVLLLKVMDKNAAAATAIYATFLAKSPQWLIGTGGSSVVLSIFFLLLSASLFLERKEGSARLKLFLLTLFLAAAILTFQPCRYPFEWISEACGIALALFAWLCVASVKLRRLRALSIVMAIACLFFYSIYYLSNSRVNCVVGRSDMEAFGWINKTIARNAVFNVNRNDAGAWIPAVTGRPIGGPGGPSKASYIYIGSKAVGSVDYDSGSLEKRPGRFRRVYTNDGAQVWKIL